MNSDCLFSCLPTTKIKLFVDKKICNGNGASFSFIFNGVFFYYYLFGNLKDSLMDFILLFNK